MEYFEKLVRLNNVIVDDILSNPSFEVSDLEDISCRMNNLMDQLEFWIQQDNKERFCWELKEHINWVLENYS